LLAAGSRSIKNRLRGSLVILFLAFTIFRALWPSSASSWRNSFISVEWYSVCSFFFELIGMVICVIFFEVFYEFPISFLCPAVEFYYINCQALCVVLFILRYFSYVFCHLIIIYYPMYEDGRRFMVRVRLWDDLHFFLLFLLRKEVVPIFYF